jgi:hypothetical protein
VDIVALQGNQEISCSDMGISRFERKLRMWRSKRFPLVLLNLKRIKRSINEDIV